MIYFLIQGIVRQIPYELVSFIILEFIFNGYCVFRDIVYMLYPQAFVEGLTVEQLNVNSGIYMWYFADLLLSLISSFIYYALASKSIVAITKVISLKAGGRKQVLVLYKYMTMVVSFLKLDGVLNTFYIYTLVFFMYFHRPTITSVWVLFLLFGIACYLVVIGYDSFLNRKERDLLIFTVARMAVEVVKLLYSILLIVGFDGGYQYSG
eukprot:CAMPEP_0202978448 /NCGR_PEP_ID=MMETSP1396-20130829/84862_1 /ASSEMBLY_ACC=CAM_ASM_000872 /TAXON_ID= /ORGANISM="Pseudokeronopsis sp., Strain Brazil" /LENGTH=207 /DNA_ID=CAMNT_0049717413 /DNA_START=177 /DNA_END=800 /DNA_ORIENTATION=+